MVDHEFELGDHQSRIEEIEDRLRQVFPAPNTQTGGAQRAILEVQRPYSVLAIGARGLLATEGRPIGPGGVGIETEEHLGVHVRGHACIDAEGLTIVHSSDPMHLLTQSTLSLASVDALRVGTNLGDIEISAGSVQPRDPHFTVAPSTPIDPMPEIDTATPRTLSERIESGWDSVWHTCRLGATAFQRYEERRTGRVSPPSIAPTVVRLTRSVLSRVSVLRAAASVAAHAVELALDAVAAEVEGPRVRIHGDGGVHIATPGGADMFGGTKVSCSSPGKAELRGGLSAAVYSPVSASCYGVAGAKLKSEAVAEVSARYVVAKGTWCEMQSRTATGLTSAGDVTVQADRNVTMEAPTIAVQADQFHLGANDVVQIASDTNVITYAHRTNTIRSDEDVQIEAERSIEQTVSRTHLKIRNETIEMTPGAGDKLTVARHSLTYGNIIRSARNGTTIRGRCNLG
ncbi:MAG: hypothetical protein KF729_36395 [Sandaracinaceae bacterium]|nr:hypothetical protein [Sandaracinaceae bacterium]